MKYLNLFIIITSLCHFSEIKNQALIVQVEVELQKKNIIEEKQIIQENEIVYPFEIIGNVSNESLLLYNQEYQNLPLNLKDGISKITISSIPLGSLCGFQSNLKVKGCAVSDTNEIYLDSIYRYGDLLHEAIHIYSYQNERVFSDEFITIFNMEGNRIAVQEGNIVNEYEYFVSAYLLYLNNPNRLAILCPKTYQFFITH